MDMDTMNLKLATTLIASALEHARHLKLKPISAAVVDGGGHLVAFQREDGSSNLRPQIALAKATSALALGVSSRQIGEMASERPTFVASLGALSRDGIVPAAGGVIVCASDGAPIGAVGITGDTSDNDEACGLHAIAAAGLRART